MKIALGNDHAGYPLKAHVRSVLEDLGHEVIDSGAQRDPVDFPDITRDTCDLVRRGEADRAVLVCGTGAGCRHGGEQDRRASGAPWPTTSTPRIRASSTTTRTQSPWARG